MFSTILASLHFNCVIFFFLSWATLYTICSWQKCESFWTLTMWHPQSRISKQGLKLMRVCFRLCVCVNTENLCAGLYCNIQCFLFNNSVSCFCECINNCCTNINFPTPSCLAVTFHLCYSGLAFLIPAWCHCLARCHENQSWNLVLSLS